MVTGSCSKVVIVASGLTGSTIWELATTISTVTSVQLARPCGHAVSAKQAGPTTSAWKLNSRKLSVAMQCQIYNQKSGASHTQSWTAFTKLVATYNFAALLFCTAQSIHGTQGRW